jgi:3-oxo-5-alpha-steroid 4-dehydrogenase 3
MARLNLESSESFLRNLSSLLAQKPIFDLVSRAIKAFYLLSSVLILIVRLIPALRERFLDYGPRGQTATSTVTIEDPKRGEGPKRPSVSIRFLDCLATFTVPHSWFTHFYVLCVACSIVQCQHDVRSRMPFPARVASGALLLQGCRRLLECLFYNRRSHSRMWIGHYLIGLAFYFFTNLAIFLDGIDWSHWDRPNSKGGKMINPEQVVFVIFFAQAFYSQSISHHYLFKLKKYTLPDQHGFRYFIAPHYTAECVLYISLAVIAAPPGYFVNWNLFCALIFVAVNLGVTADGTKRWMLAKFPDHRTEIESRRKLIPILW